jgi:hypothetical protein
MYLPPAAAWKVNSARWQRRVLAALGLLGALVGSFFVFSQHWAPSSWLVLVVLAACSAGASMGLYKAAEGQLRWDGERWHWSDGQDHGVTRLSCVIDLQRCLLLRIDCEQARILWLWLYSPAMDARWLALRRAVVASPKANSPTRAGSLPE